MREIGREGDRERGERERWECERQIRREREMLVADYFFYPLFLPLDRAVVLILFTQ